MFWIHVKQAFVIFVLAGSFRQAVGQKEAVVVLPYATCNTYTYTISEGSSQQLCALLEYVNGSATLMNNQTILFTLVNGTAIGGLDFPNIVQSVTFVAGSAPGTTLCVGINTINDVEVETTETFSVTLVAANPSAVATVDRAGGTTATISITDTDPSTFTLDGNYTVTQSNGTFMVCAVLLSGPTSTTVGTSVNLKFTTTGITATGGTDFSAVSSTVTVAAGLNIGGTVCQSVTIISNNFVSNNLTFSLAISAGSRTVVVAARSISYFTIINTNVAIIGIWASNPASSTEINGPINVCAVITNTVVLRTAVTVVVNMQNITAISGVDYLPPTTPTISFASGAKSVDSPLCTSFQLLQDTVVEYNDNFTIYLTSSFPTSQVQISPTTGSLTFTIIEDDDTVLIGFANTTLNTSEGVNAQICAQIKNGTLGRSVSVYVSTTALGTATANVDYTPLTLAQIVFNSGASSSVNSVSCCTLVILDDDAVENAETISLSMSGSFPVSIQPSISSCLVTIVEGSTDYVTIGLGNSINVTEGINSTTAVCAMIFHGSLEVSISVTAFTSNITAIPSVDYESKSGTLTFPIGSTVGKSVCFTIGIYDDLKVENPDVFSVNLQSSDTRAVIVPGQAQITVTIYNSPSDVITLGFQNPVYQPMETDPSVAVCVLMLAGQLDKTIPVTVVTTDGTATGGLDYVPLNTIINFYAGIIAGSSLCTSITLLDDALVETGPETFTVTISVTDPSAVIQAPTTTVNIVEDPH